MEKPPTRDPLPTPSRLSPRLSPKSSSAQSAALPSLSSTDRTRLLRHPERGRADRAALHAVLDAGWVVHVAFCARGSQPLAIPTTYVRVGETLYIHGAVASGMLRAAAAGIELCATVTLIDGLVLAKSAFHHSMNYRSAVILGRARPVLDEAEKRQVLLALLDRLMPGRGALARPPSTNELKITSVLALPLDEASVKVRTGPPIEDETDLSLPVWAGVIPLAVESGLPQASAEAAGAPPARTLAGPVERAKEIVEQHHGDWLLSDDDARVDFARVGAWLAGTYWCPGIPREAVERSARHSSLVVGAYDRAATQVGYLRVVSDRTRFANIMDVFVAPEHRQRGLGRALVRFALAHPEHRAISRWMLGTKDAHGVYAHEGFRPIEEPQRLMQRIGPAAWAEPG